MYIEFLIRTFYTLLVRRSKNMSQIIKRFYIGKIRPLLSSSTCLESNHHIKIRNEVSSVKSHLLEKGGGKAWHVLLGAYPSFCIKTPMSELVNGLGNVLELKNSAFSSCEKICWEKIV